MFREPEKFGQKNQGLLACHPEICITHSAFELMMSLIRQHAPKEISGLGEVELIDSNQLVITKIHYFGGDHTRGHTEITSQLGDWLYKLAQDGGDPAKIHLWWHSHADMQVFWSPTDQNTMDRHVADRYLISVVGNTRSEFRCRIDVYDPFHMYIDNVPFPKFYIGPKTPVWEQAEDLIKRFSTTTKGFLGNLRTTLFGDKKGEPNEPVSSSVNVDSERQAASSDDHRDRGIGEPHSGTTSPDRSAEIDTI